MRREQLDWLLGPERGARDLGEVGLLPLILVPVVLLLCIAALHWATT
jgi:hypothetical protein